MTQSTLSVIRHKMIRETESAISRGLSASPRLTEFTAPPTPRSPFKVMALRCLVGRLESKGNFVDPQWSSKIYSS